MRNSRSLLRDAFFLLVPVLALLLALPAPLPAAEGQPYRLRVVLLLAKHRLLTEVLADTLERELGDGLQAALGGMANVEVLRKHELQEKIERLGLQAALEGFQQREKVKTHFVLVEVVDTFYQIRTLQHDGETGQTGPIVRTERTRDRDFVFRLAALMIEKDFGLLGRVLDNPDAGGRVNVQLQGTGQGWSRWVRPGDVFALVSASAGNGPSELVGSAYLRVITPPRENDATGACVCQVANRFKLPALAGCRAVKLGSTEGSLRLRLVQDLGENRFRPMTQELVLYLRRDGFEGESARVQTDPLGLFDTAGMKPTEKQKTPGVFDRLLFVSVFLGNQPLAQVPIPLVGQTEVVIPITLGKGDNPLKVLRDHWDRNVAEAVLVQSIQMRDIQKLAGQVEQREATRKRIERALDRSRGDLLHLRQQRGELVAQAEKAGTTATLQLDTGDKRLRQIEDAVTELKDFLAKLDAIEQMENDPRRREALARVEEATLLEKQGELGKAIAIYEQLRASEVNVGNIEGKIADLKKVWDPKSSEHAAARKFIYEVYPTLDTPGLQANLAELRRSLDECRKSNDKLGLRKMLDLTATHALRVEKEKLTVRTIARVEDAAQIDLLNTVGEALKLLGRDLALAVGVAAPAG